MMCMRLDDQSIVKSALKIYARHLRGLEDIEQTTIIKNTLKRVEKLQEKEVKANSVGITIKLDY